MEDRELTKEEIALIEDAYAAYSKHVKHVIDTTIDMTRKKEIEKLMTFTSERWFELNKRCIIKNVSPCIFEGGPEQQTYTYFLERLIRSVEK